MFFHRDYGFVVIVVSGTQGGFGGGLYLGGLYLGIQTKPLRGGIFLGFIFAHPHQGLQGGGLFYM